MHPVRHVQMSGRMVWSREDYSEAGWASAGMPTKSKVI
jgi:hypothetical protein